MAVQRPSTRRHATRASSSNKKDSVAIAVFGAGAPHAGLMAGALAYMYRYSKKTFDVFFTSGGGALISLLFVAPRDKKRPDEALREVAEFGVDDRIYQAFPVGYKTFFKNSQFTELFREWAESYKLHVEPRPFPGEDPPASYDPRQQRRRRLYNDWIDFWFSALTPPTIGPTSAGLCSHLPFLEAMVDFDRVNKQLSPSGFDFTIPVMVSLNPPIAVYLNYGWFYVNAYNLDTKSLQQFSNAMTAPRGSGQPGPVEPPKGFAGPLTPAAIRAALSFPFIYPPHPVNGALYCEGADVDPLNLPDMVGVVRRRDAGMPSQGKLPTVRVFLFDILGALEKTIMFSPRNLWEAYGLSILTPVVSLAKMSETIYRKTPDRPELIDVPFAIPRQRRDRPLDWSYSNTTALWDAGWEAGKKFLAEHGDKLPDRVDD